MFSGRLRSRIVYTFEGGVKSMCFFGSKSSVARVVIFVRWIRGSKVALIACRGIMTSAAAMIYMLIYKEAE